MSNEAVAAPVDGDEEAAASAAGHGRLAEPAIGSCLPGVVDRCDRRKVRDSQVANRPVYVAIGVNLDGERASSGCGSAPRAGRAPSNGRAC